MATDSKKRPASRSPVGPRPMHPPDGSDYHLLAQKHHMQLKGIEQLPGGGQTFTLSGMSKSGKEHEFTLTNQKNKFQAATNDTHLLDNLFLDNLEDVLKGSRLEAVLQAAGEVLKCILDGEEAEMDGGEGGNFDYEYDDMDDGHGLVAEADEPPKNKATGAHYMDESMPIPGWSKAKAGNANTRLMRDLSKMMRSDTNALGFSLEPKHQDSMNVWRVKLFGFKDCPLEKDFEKLKAERGQDYADLEMTFKDDYPFSPPFIRVLTPRFVKQTGFILGGAFCMELLTKQGWTPTNDIESVLVQIRAQMVVGVARIDFESAEPYHEAAAISSFRHAAAQHNWAID